VDQGCFEPTPLADLFPHEDYRLQMRFTRGRPEVFFGPTATHAEVIAERKRWLTESPETYSALLEPGEPLLLEATELSRRWHGFQSPLNLTPAGLCRALGSFWEADFLLLKADGDGEIRLVGGCLCFPSHWRLADKIGKPIEFIHGPVPGLNENLGASIHKFLTALKPGVASQRVNWGLSRSAELNQHPDRTLPRLDTTVSLDEVWLRVEEQALVALPASGGILFGIRIVNHPLSELREDPLLAARFCQALATMPEGMARYKNLLGARPVLIEMLTR